MTRIAFTGDVAFTKYFSGSCDRENLISEEVQAYLCDTDCTVVNVEGAIKTSEANNIGEFVHANPSGILSWLNRINGKILTLANNHIADCGVEGIIGTLQFVRNRGYIPIGLGENAEIAATPAVIDGAGGVGVFSVTYDVAPAAGEDRCGCIMWDDEETIEKIINCIKSKHRWCVIVVHSGREFSHLPMPYVRKQYLRYLEMGADIVVGHHPHVVENYETVGEKIVFYSLGNFIFDTDYQRSQKYTENGMLIRLSFEEAAFTWDYMPILIDRETQTIRRGPCPAIFRNFTPAQYRLMWPRAAQNYIINFRKKALYQREECRSYTLWDWITKYEMEFYRQHLYARQAMHGRLLSVFQLWRLGDKEIKAYLSNKGWNSKQN